MLPLSFRAKSRNGASGTSDMDGCAAREAARESGDERVQSLRVNDERCLDSARHDRQMTPLVYLILGLIAGGLFAAIACVLTRCTSAGGSDFQAELVRRREMLNRGLREELSRSRNERVLAAKC